MQSPESPLHASIRKKELSTVKKTIDKGEKDLIERTDKDNRTALHIAADTGHPDILKFILKNVKNKNLINAVDKAGNTALLLAAEGGHRKVVQELLKAGSNTLVVNNQGQTVLHCLLGAPFWRSDHTKILKLILEKPQVEINRLNNDGITAIQMACAKGNYDAGLLLLKCKADPTIVKGGEPPLFSAVYAENPALVRELLTHGADISQPNSKLQTLMEIVNPKCEIYRIIKKHLLSRPGGERKLRLASEECIVATNVSQLPPDLKRIVDSSKLKVEDIEANWDVFCSVIHFVGKKRIFPNAEEAAKAQERNKKSQMATDKTAEETRELTEQLISHGNPKKIYKKLRIAGKGGFGMVFMGTGPDKKNWAIKRMPHSSEKERRANLVEANFLKNCNHPNIVSYKASYYCEEEHEMWLIMELMEGGTLDEAVGEDTRHPFEEKHLAFAAREILKGLEYLHGKGIAHRDLKAQNVMMSVQGDVKIIDFGLAIELHGGTKVEMCGSPYWLPPEMIMRQAHSYPCDIWSMAVCILELANRHPPNNDSALRHMFNVATKKPPGLDKPDAWSDSFKDFLQCCLQQDQTKRATATELLKHRFISKAATGPEMAKLLRSVFISHQIRDVAIA